MANQWNSIENRVKSLERWTASHERTHAGEKMHSTLESYAKDQAPVDPSPQGEWPALNNHSVREYLIDWLEHRAIGRRVAPLELWMELARELHIAEEPRLLVRAPGPTPSRAGGEWHEFEPKQAIFADGNCQRCGMPRGAWQHEKVEAASASERCQAQGPGPKWYQCVYKRDHVGGHVWGSDNQVTEARPFA